MQVDKPVDIILAEDDDDDYKLIEDAVKQTKVTHRLFRVKNGELLIKGLENPEGVFGSSVNPTLVFLDINMPVMGGLETLKVMKSHPDMRSIPVVVMTTSKLKDDILRAYKLGVNSYLQKPISFEELLSQVKSTLDYWLNIVELPQRNN